jgi:hypothetical protein
VPIQEFVRPNTEEIAAEIRWDFDFSRVIIVHHGSVLAVLDDTSTLKSRGLSITTKHGTIVDVQMFDDPLGVRFEIHEDAVALAACEPKWGTSPDAAGLLHMPSSRQVAEGIASYSYERPIRVGQRWLLYLGLLNFSLGVASTLVKNDVPSKYAKYYDAINTNLITGVVIGAAFLILSLLTSRSRAIVTLGLGLVLTTMSVLTIGSILSKDLPYPPITYARFGIHLFGFFVMALGWKAAIDFSTKRRSKFNREGLVVR